MGITTGIMMAAAASHAGIEIALGTDATTLVAQHLVAETNVAPLVASPGLTGTGIPSFPTYSVLLASMLDTSQNTSTCLPPLFT